MPESSIVYHIVPENSAKDGVADYQTTLIDRLRAAGGDDLMIMSITFREALALPRRHGTQFHLQLPMQAWRKKVLLPLAVHLLRLRFPRARLLITIHEWSFTKPLRRLVNLPMLWLADHIICPTPDVKGELVALPAPLRPRAAAGATLIPIGPNFSWRARREAGPQPATIGYFGLLYPAKLPFVMLDAVSRVAAERPVRFVMVGDFIPHHRALRQRFVEFVEQPANSWIDWHGYVENPADAMEILSGCSAFVLLNERGLTERNGSLLTCLQFGVPVLTSPPLEEEAVQSQWLVDCLASGQLRLAGNHTDPSALADDITRLIAASVSGTRPYEGFDLWARIVSDHLSLYRRGPA